MQTIFNQIKRFGSSEFKIGEAFTVVLPPAQVDNTPHKTINVVNIDGTQIKLDDKMEVGKSYKITVKKYMTEPSTPQFDFHKSWNGDKPMPLRVMVGKVVKETRGMYQMELRGQAENTSTCIHCGRTLTNPVSRLYGIGPECGKHFYINPFNTEEELREHLQEITDKISGILWSGWVIKSSITEWEEV